MFKFEEIVCPECGFVGYEEDYGIKSVYEFADADGNRGTWISYFVCPECKETF
jgi:acetone carboxylase gamma subunit